MALRMAMAAALVAGLALLAAATFVAWPLPPRLLAREGVVSLRFTDRAGVLLRELPSREDGRSLPLPAELPVPGLVRQAFLAAEDHRFEHHPGIDPLALARAGWQDLRAGRIVSGASTIPQQLARRLVPRGRTLAGKVAEALWALRLSMHLPREQVLREYLDRVPLGNSTFGVQAAAELYFARPAAALSLGQAALLAGMARSPAPADPFRHLAAARARQAAVLGRMEALGMISAAEARVARETPLDLVPPEHLFRAPHLVQRLSRDLGRLGLDAAARVETTLDFALQADVESLVREEISGLVARRVGQAAAIVVDNATGAVLAYVGSADFLDEEHLGQNDGVRALRQPGSALKPFAYGLALTNGLTPASVLSDVETHLATPTGDYAPRNYDRRAHGPVRLRAALANSYNVPAVRLTEQLGPERVLEVLHRAGFESLTEDAAYYGVGLVLGDGSVSLRELVRAYRGLARGGVAEPLVEVRAAVDALGRPLPVAREMAPRRFLPEPAVALLTDILSDEAARAPAFGLDNALRLPFPVAAKTGTSRAHVDNWAVGFTRERTVAVWVGNFDGTSMRGVSGITGAAPMLRRILLRAMDGIAAPEPLVDRSRFDQVAICPLSGERAGAECPSRLEERFLPGTAPRESCPMHRALVTAHGTRSVLDLGPAYYAWARGEGLQAGPWSGAEAGAPAGLGQVRLLSPSDGDEYLLEPGLPLQDQTIPVRAVVPAGVSRVEVRTDDGASRDLAAPFSARVPARRGERRLELWIPGAAAPAAIARYTVR